MEIYIVYVCQCWNIFVFYHCWFCDVKNYCVVYIFVFFFSLLKYFYFFFLYYWDTVNIVDHHSSELYWLAYVAWKIKNKIMSLSWMELWGKKKKFFISQKCVYEPNRYFSHKLNFIYRTSNVLYLIINY